MLEVTSHRSCRPDVARILRPRCRHTIVSAVRAGEQGQRETTRDGARIAVSFVRLATIGWYFVVEVDAVTLGGT
jgi:hypothetical protein